MKSVVLNIYDESKMAALLGLLRDLRYVEVRGAGEEAGSDAPAGEACPLCAAYEERMLEGHPLPPETLAAIQEARDIMSGKIKTKAYSSAEELHDEIEAEMYAEEEAKTERFPLETVC
jgi:hypothetical protein